MKCSVDECVTKAVPEQARMEMEECELAESEALIGGACSFSTDSELRMTRCVVHHNEATSSRQQCSTHPSVPSPASLYSRVPR